MITRILAQQKDAQTKLYWDQSGILLDQTYFGRPIVSVTD